MSIQDIISEQVKSNRVVLYMKGTPQVPAMRLFGDRGRDSQALRRDGFSRRRRPRRRRRSARASRITRTGRPFRSSTSTASSSAAATSCARCSSRESCSRCCRNRRRSPPPRGAGVPSRPRGRALSRAQGARYAAANRASSALSVSETAAKLRSPSLQAITLKPRIVASRSGCATIAGRSPREDVDDVAVQPVDDATACRFPTLIDPRAEELEPLRGQVAHHRREFEPPLKPRAHHVAVGRRDVDARTCRRERRDVLRHGELRQRFQHARLREPPAAERAQRRRSTRRARSACHQRSDRDRGVPAAPGARSRAGSTSAVPAARPGAASAARSAVRIATRCSCSAAHAGHDREVLRHLGGRRRVELVVDVGIQHPQGERAVHRRDTLCANSIRCCSRSRPRASRDITVPMGMSTIALISL